MKSWPCRVQVPQPTIKPLTILGFSPQLESEAVICVLADRLFYTDFIPTVELAVRRPLIPSADTSRVFQPAPIATEPGLSPAVYALCATSFLAFLRSRRRQQAISVTVTNKGSWKLAWPTGRGSDVDIIPWRTTRVGRTLRSDARPGHVYVFGYRGRLDLLATERVRAA